MWVGFWICCCCFCVCVSVVLLVYVCVCVKMCGDLHPFDYNFLWADYFEHTDANVVCFNLFSLFALFFTCFLLCNEWCFAMIKTMRSFLFCLLFVCLFLHTYTVEFNTKNDNGAACSGTHVLFKNVVKIFERMTVFRFFWFLFFIIWFLFQEKIANILCYCCFWFV